MGKPKSPSSGLGGLSSTTASAPGRLRSTPFSAARSAIALAMILFQADLVSTMLRLLWTGCGGGV